MLELINECDETKYLSNIFLSNAPEVYFLVKSLSKPNSSYPNDVFLLKSSSIILTILLWCIIDKMILCRPYFIKI